MYLEAEKLSQEVLAVYPRDEAAQSNAVAARNSMTLRSHGVGRASTVEEGARSFYDEEAEEDDQGGDQDGEEEDDDEDDGHPLPEKASANAGSGGSAAAPAKSLRDDDSCPRGVAA